MMPCRSFAPVVRKKPQLQYADPNEFPITEPPSILIVEDDPHMAEIISTLLCSNWFNCSVRRSGAQGIEAYIRNPVDLIITDLRMSVGDGITLIESIRQFSAVPVIIVTGFAHEYADRVRFLNNIAVITKPFETKVLVDLVDKALDSSNSGSCSGWNLPPKPEPAKP